MNLLQEIFSSALEKDSQKYIGDKQYINKSNKERGDPFKAYSQTDYGTKFVSDINTSWRTYILCPAIGREGSLPIIGQ